MSRKKIKYIDRVQELKSLGKHLQSLRKQEGFTQKELAEKVGLSKGSIAQAEGGFAKPAFEHLRYFAHKGKDVFNILNLAATQLNASSPSSDKIAAIDPGRAFDHIAGLTKEETLCIAQWLRANPEMKELIIEWTKLREDGHFDSEPEADRLEFDTKAKAFYIIHSVKRKLTKDVKAKG